MFFVSSSPKEFLLNDFIPSCFTAYFLYKYMKNKWILAKIWGVHSKDKEILK